MCRKHVKDKLLNKSSYELKQNIKIKKKKKNWKKRVLRKKKSKSKEI